MLCVIGSKTHSTLIKKVNHPFKRLLGGTKLNVRPTAQAPVTSILEDIDISNSEPMQREGGSSELRPPEPCGQDVFLRQKFDIEVVGQEEGRETTGSVKLRTAEQTDEHITRGESGNVKCKVGAGSEAEVNWGPKADPFGISNGPAGADPRRHR